jgi:hypothetical protein
MSTCPLQRISNAFVTRLLDGYFSSVEVMCLCRRRRRQFVYLRRPMHDKPGLSLITYSKEKTLPV